MANISISLEGIDQAIENLNYRPSSAKYKVLVSIRKFYSSKQSIKELENIDTDSLIKSIWDVGNNPAKIKSKRRNFSSIKSSINADLKKLSKKNLNTENIMISDANIFDMTEEAKNNLLSSFTDAVKTGDIDFDQAANLLKAVSDFLDNYQTEDDQVESEDIVNQVKKILNKLTEDVLSEEELETTPGIKKLKSGDTDFEEIEDLDGDEAVEELEDFDESGRRDEDVEEIELDEDEEIEEVDDLDFDDEDIEEIELDEDEDLEEIELDEDEEIEEVDDLGYDDEDTEEIELDEDEDLEDIEFDDEEIEELETLDESGGRDEDVEEIELDEDEEIEEVDDLDFDDGDTEETELDEDEDLEDIEFDDDEEIEELEDFDESGGRDEDVEEIELDEDEEIEEVDDLDFDDGDTEEIELDEDEDLEDIEFDDEEVEELETLDESGGRDEAVEEIELDEDEEIEEVDDLDYDDEDTEEIELDEDEDLEEIEFDDDEEEIEELETLDELDELDEDIEEIELDDDEELEELDLDEDIEELDDDELEEVDELDEDELKALEEFRAKKELAEQFDETLGDREKKYNKYTTVPEGNYTVGTRKNIKSNLELQQFDMPKVYIGVYPVTNALFEIFIDETGYVTTAEKMGVGRVYTSRYKKRSDESSISKSAGSDDIEGACWFRPFGPGSNLHGKRNHPVVQVSVDDSLAFASWIGRRIPTEAEWESAARTDLGLKYPWGNDFNKAALNIEQSGHSDTTSVDEYDAFANEFNIIDLLGNTMEWTCDTQTSPIKTTADKKYCIAKGAAWNSGSDATISSRALFKPGFCSNTIGFRCISEIFL